LQREGQVRDLAVILRDINLPLVDAFPEAVQQLLLESNVDRGLYGRIEEKRRRRRRTAGVVPRHEHTCAGGEPLRVLGVERGCVRRKCTNSGYARSGNERVIYRDNARVDRIRASELRIEAQARNVGLRKGNACSRSSAAYSSTCGTKKIRIREPKVVSGNDDVHVVFKRQVDRILQTEIQLAFADQLIDSRGIRESRIRNGDWFVWREEIGKCTGRARVAEFRSAQRNGRRGARSHGCLRGSPRILLGRILGEGRRGAEQQNSSEKRRHQLSCEQLHHVCVSPQVSVR
jgi:hypothetical protein